MTVAENVKDLHFASIVKSVRSEAKSLQKKGSDIIILLAHDGGECHKFDNPRDLSSCDSTQSIFRVAKKLSPKLIKAIVAGHTHSGVAHFVNGIPIIESYRYNTAFGRIDLRIDPKQRKILSTKIYRPQNLCKNWRDERAPCKSFSYEGKKVVEDKKIATIIEPAFARAKQLKQRKLGVMVSKKLTRKGDQESPLTNLFADLLRQTWPKADVAIYNGAGIRANLHQGPLLYGELYEAHPFDNSLATITLKGWQLRKLVHNNLKRGLSIVVLSGATAEARCRGKDLEVTLRRNNGKLITDDESLHIATSDFLAWGGNSFFKGIGTKDSDFRIHTDKPIRDEIVKVLEKRGGSLGTDPSIFDRNNPRLRYPGKRPVRCN